MRPARLLPALTVAAVLALPGGMAQAQSGSELNERLERLERRLESSALIELMNTSEQLRQELTALRGDIEVLRREVQEIKERQREIYVDVDDRLRALETAADDSDGDGDGGGSAGADTAAGAADGDTGETADAGDGTASGDGPATGQSAAGAASEDGEAGADESQAYQAAFETLRDGRYEQAAEQFRRFLEAYPDGELAANARYWLGEAHYVVREFDAALEHFQRVLEDYPESNKRPDALLKIGFVHFEEDRREQAREALEQVVEEYPETTAANLANQRLERL